MGSRVFAWLRALALVGVVLLMAATSAGALQSIGARFASQASSVNYGARLKQAFTVDVAAADNGGADNSDAEDNSGSDADNEDNSGSDADNSGSDADNSDNSGSDADNSGSDKDNEDNSSSDDGDNKDDDSATDPDIIIDNVAPRGA